MAAGDGLWLADACRAGGYATVWLDPRHPAKVQGAAAVLYDACSATGGDLDALRRLVADVAPIPVVALLHFPRIEDHDRVRQAGAAAVLSKPLQVADLLVRLRAL